MRTLESLAYTYLNYGENEKAKLPESVNGDVGFDNVDFSYSKNDRAAINYSFEEIWNNRINST